LDDDAVVASPQAAQSGALLLRHLAETSSSRLVVLPRGGENQTALAMGEINYKNFSSKTIEWNVIYPTELFNKFGGFPRMGPGSPSLAQCGEAFVLNAALLNHGYKFEVFSGLSVVHPPLSGLVSPIRAKGYAYGDGYAIGLSVNRRFLLFSIYWLTRFLVSTIAVAVFLKRPCASVPTESIVARTFRARLIYIKYRTLGLADALFAKSPRTGQP
jgi:hypothetical protein